MRPRVPGITGGAGAAMAMAITLVGIVFFGDRSIDSRDTEPRAEPISPARSQRRTIDAPAPDSGQPDLSKAAAAEPKAANAAAEERSNPVNPQKLVERPLGWPTFSETELRFALEDRDVAWSRQAESDIFGSLSLISDLGLLQAEVECRESLCRVQLLFPGRSETTFALRRIFALSKNIGLGPVSSSTGIEVGDLPVLWLFLRRIPVNAPA